MSFVTDFVTDFVESSTRLVVHSLTGGAGMLCGAEIGICAADAIVSPKHWFSRFTTNLTGITIGGFGGVIVSSVLADKAMDLWFCLEDRHELIDPEIARKLAAENVKTKSGKSIISILGETVTNLKEM